jgi:uncharacterized protein (DUF488 family)
MVDRWAAEEDVHDSAGPTIWTIGHSALESDEFFGLLAAEKIAALVDVRSQPFSRFAPQANRDVLEHAAKAHGIRYLHCGDDLGGRPADPGMLLKSGKPDYERMGAAAGFRRSLEELMLLGRKQRVCILCSEEDPGKCHRGLLVSESLVRAGCAVLHIRHDGTVEAHGDMLRRITGGQLTLF